MQTASSAACRRATIPSSPRTAGRAAEILIMRDVPERLAVRAKAEVLPRSRNQRKSRKKPSGEVPQNRKKNKISKANNRHSNREPRRTVSRNKPREALNVGKEKARRSRRRAGNCPLTVCRPKTILPRTGHWTCKSCKTITKRLPNRWMRRVRHTCRP